MRTHKKVICKQKAWAATGKWKKLVKQTKIKKGVKILFLRALVNQKRNNWVQKTVADREKESTNKKNSANIKNSDAG